MNCHLRPGAGNLEGYDFPVGACVCNWRKSKLPFERAFQRNLGWRTQRYTRCEPSSAAADASCEKSQAVKAKKQRFVARHIVIANMVKSNLAVDLGFAVSFSCQEFDHLEFVGGLDPNLAGGRTKKGSAQARRNFHVKCIRPPYRIGGHGQVTSSAMSRR
jgi:hypothetical protein